jgi:outer membrane protein OmpA-like peptidoglycan-associated protein
MSPQPAEPVFGFITKHPIKGVCTVKAICVILLSAAVVTGVGCGMSRKTSGGAIGAGAGGAVGGIVGHQFGHTALGAIIGAAVGGTTGVLIGNEMDKRAAEMRQDMAGTTIERVGEGIKITFDSGLLFDVNKSDLRAQARRNIERLAQTLNKYADTDVLVEGDTDDSGSDSYNLDLSNRRAQSVTGYLQTLGVAGSRVSSVGLGESNPVAGNDTEYGRQQNRRVEVAIFANEKLKKAAEGGKLN